jgi:hypothetical protein
MRTSNLSSVQGLWHATAVAAILAFHPSSAKLYSAGYQQERARQSIEDIYRETRLDAGASFWGEQYKQDIDRYTQVFRTTNYMIFGDLQIEGAMARCAVNARNQSDYDVWVRRMDLFDRAAEELDPHDRSRYYFAKGLALLQSIPGRLRELPKDFYKAAENGLSSVQWADYVVKAGTQTTGFGTEQLNTVLVRFAESYTSGGLHDEAFKMYLLALKGDQPEPDLFVRLAETADRGGSQRLAYRCALLFVALCDLRDGVRVATRAPLDSMRISARMSAYDVWNACDGGMIDLALRAVPRSPRVASTPIKERQVSRFDTRYVQPLGRCAGPFDDLLKIAVCQAYWADSGVVARFLPQVGGSIDAHDGTVRAFADRVRDDPRFAGSKEAAVWESRRWREANKLDEFARLYPERHRLAGLGGN